MGTPRRGAAAARRALAIAGAVASVFATLVIAPAAPAAADPGHPGVAQDDPVELFHEDFELHPDSEPMLLSAYVRADGGTYTGDPSWISASACNGIITNPNGADVPDCANNGQIRQLAGLLGAHNGLGDANSAVSAYTAGDPAPNAIQLETEVSGLDVEDRFLTFSVDVAAVNCDVSGPLLHFWLVDESDISHPATGGPVNPCAAAVNGQAVGTFTSDTAVLYTGTELGIVMRNFNSSGIGNDHAVDDLRVLDVTPQLDKAFVPAQIHPGGTVRMVFTITNTTELAAKPGWSFTDDLPPGLTIAANPNFTSTCAPGAITSGGSAGDTSVSFQGSLAAGMESCTLEIDVTVDPLVVPGTDITNAGSVGGNVTDLVGLNPPADAVLSVPSTIDPRACVASGASYALFTFNPPITGGVVGSGEAGTWARYATVAVVDGTPVDMIATVLEGRLNQNGRPFYFGASGGNALWNVPDATPTRLRFEFVEAGTTIPVTVSAAFVTSDMDAGERAVFDSTDLTAYTLPLSSLVTVTEAAGSVTFAGGGNGSFDPRASFQTLLEGISSYESTWTGGSNSGFGLNGNGAEVFPPQCWTAEKTVISPGTPAPGATLTYEVVLTNTGEVDLVGVTMVDDLADVLAHATWVGDQVATAGTSSFDPVQETLTWTGDLPLGGDPVRITYSVVLADDAPVGELLTNTVTGPTNCPSDSCTNDTTVVPPAPLFFDCASLTTFDTGAEGWRVATVSGGVTPPVIGPLPVAWTDVDGNPGGAIVSDDLDGNWTEIWTPPLAPYGYATDYSSAIGQMLRFDYRNDTGIGYDVYVAIEGANGDRVYYVFRDQIVDSTGWNQITVPMDPAQWVTGFADGSGPVGAAPTEAEFAEILAEVDHVAFSVEGQLGDDRTWFDNFGRFCPEPGMTVDKAYAHDDADGDGELSVGEAITYTFTVENTGNTQLTGIVVTDDLPGLSPIQCPEDRLFPSDPPMVCEATYVVTQADIDAGGITNQATVTGSPPAGLDPVTQPSNEVVIVGPAHDPGLSVVKDHTHDDADGDGELTVGEEIDFTFTVTNTGNVTISDIAITDQLPGLGPVDCPSDELAPADPPMVCEAAYVVTQADIDAGGITNQATVTGTAPSGDPVEVASNEVTIAGPERVAGLDLLKTFEHADRNGDGRVSAGEVLTYRFRLTNTGNVTLEDLAVDDPMPGLSAVSCPTSVLLPGETITCTARYVVTQADQQAGRIVNTAVASASGPNGLFPQVLSAASTAVTDVQAPAPGATGRGVLPRTGGAVEDLTQVAFALLLAGVALTSPRLRRREVT